MIGQSESATRMVASPVRALAALAVFMLVLSAESTFSNKFLLPDGRRTVSHSKLRRSVDDPMCAKPPLGIALSAVISKKVDEIIR